MRWILCNRRSALAIVSLALFAGPIVDELAAQPSEPTLQQLLETVRPKAPTRIQPRLQNRIQSSASVDRGTSNQPAQRLWGVPIPAADQVDFPAAQLWSANPQVSNVYRALSLPANQDRKSTDFEALRDIQYPRLQRNTSSTPGSVADPAPASWSRNQRTGAELFGDVKVVSERAQHGNRIAREHCQYGFELARRGATYSAEEEFLEALWTIAHSNDEATQSLAHSDALRSALQTLKESDDFASLVRESNDPTEVARRAAQHESASARLVVHQQPDAIGAMQTYLGDCQSLLVRAIAGDSAGSDALYGLARSMRANSSAARNEGFATAKAMAILLAAHTVRSGDHKIANELGVLYAQLGQLADAERMLKQSLLSAERPETWSNLSTVWEMTGKGELALYANRRAERVRLIGAERPVTRVHLVDAESLIASATTEARQIALKANPIQNAASSSGNDSNTKPANWVQRLKGLRQAKASQVSGEEPL